MQTGENQNRSRPHVEHSLAKNYVLFASMGAYLTRYHFNLKTGLVALQTIEMPQNVQYACFHPTQPIVYVACSNGGVADLGDSHCLVSLTIDDSDMKLIAKPLALPYRPLHVSVDERSQRLALAYNRPAAVTFHELNEHGCVNDLKFQLEDVDRVGYFPHQIIPIPDSEDFIVSCRGDDATATHPENPGSLRILREMHNDVRCIQIISPHHGFGFGPRNCAFHPGKPLLYTVLERQNQLAVFRLRENSIESEPAWSVNLLKSTNPAHTPQLGGAIIVHPNGGFAYVVNRSHPSPNSSAQQIFQGENSIVVFKLDALTGEPQIVQRMELNGLHARCITLSDDGTVLIAALRQGGRISRAEGEVTEYFAGFACFRVSDSGCLSLVHQEQVDVWKEQLFWADFAPECTA